LGIESASCLVLEDAISGITSGWASGAGMVIGVGEEILELTEKELVISDLRGISYVDGQFLVNEEYRLR
jgi:beta-phosphoglucomutase-like phosphatase (HAD superfamily)